MSATKPNIPAKAADGRKQMTAFGFVAIIFGMLAMLAPVLTGASIAMLLGGLAAVSGILRMLWAFQSGRVGRGLWKYMIGGLTLLCGLALLANPLFAAGVLTTVLAAYFIFDGISEIVVGFGRPGHGGGWLLLSGIVSVLLGALIWAQFPLSGAWAMGTLLGIKLFFIGLTVIATGSGVRSMATT
jgi:uncharacterized membrane protein HdeD (DUF308 family)